MHVKCREDLFCAVLCAGVKMLVSNLGPEVTDEDLQVWHQSSCSLFGDDIGNEMSIAGALHRAWWPT